MVVVFRQDPLDRAVQGLVAEGAVIFKEGHLDAGMIFDVFFFPRGEGRLGVPGRRKILFKQILGVGGVFQGKDPHGAVQLGFELPLVLVEHEEKIQGRELRDLLGPLDGGSAGDGVHLTGGQPRVAGIQAVVLHDVGGQSVFGAPVGVKRHHVGALEDAAGEVLHRRGVPGGEAVIVRPGLHRDVGRAHLLAGDQELALPLRGLGKAAHDVDVALFHGSRGGIEAVELDDLDLPVGVAGDGVIILDIVALVSAVVILMHEIAVVKITHAHRGFGRIVCGQDPMGKKGTEKKSEPKKHNQRQNSHCFFSLRTVTENID